MKQQPGNANAATPLARALPARERPYKALKVLDKILLAAPADLRALNAKAVALDSEDVTVKHNRVISASRTHR